MKKNEYLIVIGVTVVIAVLGLFVTPYFFLGLIAVAGYIGYLYQEHKKEGVVEPQEETIKDMSSDGVKMNWQSEIPTEKAYKYLLKVNYELRVNGNYVSQDHVDVIETLIDDLRELVLVMDDSTSVLKWKINQICVEFMPQLIGKFNKASNQSREEIMGATINDIQGRVTEIKTAIETNQQEEFEHYAQTLQKIMAV